LLLKRKKIQKPSTKKIAERIALTSIVIAWGVGITSGNLFVLINGMKPPLIGKGIWKYWMSVGVLLGIIYALYKSHIKEKK